MCLDVEIKSISSINTSLNNTLLLNRDAITSRYRYTQTHSAQTSDRVTSISQISILEEPNPASWYIAPGHSPWCEMTSHMTPALPAVREKHDTLVRCYSQKKGVAGVAGGGLISNIDTTSFFVLVHTHHTYVWLTDTHQPRPSFLSSSCGLQINGSFVGQQQQSAVVPRPLTAICHGPAIICGGEKSSVRLPRWLLPEPLVIFSVNP